MGEEEREAPVRVVLTGATGYIGGRLAQTLAEGGHEVSALLRESSDTTALRASVPGITILRFGDNIEDLTAGMSEASAQIVMHLAADQNQSDDLDAVGPLVQTNVELTASLAAAAVAAGVTGFINTGSFSQHMDGTEQYSPSTMYAATKQAAAAILEYYRQATPMTCTTLQLTDVYGADDNRPKILNLLFEASKNGERLDMSPGEQLLDFVHVDDVARAFISVAEGMLDGQSFDPVYSVGSNRALSLREVVRVWQESSGCSVEVDWGGRAYAPRQIMAPYLHQPPPGWVPTISLESGLAQVYGKPDK